MPEKGSGKIQQPTESAILNKCDGNNIREKRNYEIAKQIGHLFLHTTYVNAMTEGKPLLITDDLSDTVNEAQANIFADTLVMPQDEFTKEVKQNVHDGRADMKKVAKKFGVTYDRALVRASRLNLIEW